MSSRSFTMLTRLVTFVLIAVAALSLQTAQAQSVFVYDEFEGGLVDTTTGLVWVDVTNDIGLATYDFAVNNMPDLYTAWGSPHDDWRIPTIAEFQDSYEKGLDDAMIANGNPMPYSVHWASDPKFKYRGKWYAYRFNILNGAVETRSINGAIYIILVRQIPNWP